MSDNGVLIEHTASGYRKTVLQSDYNRVFSREGWTIVRIDWLDLDDDVGAWDTGPTYVISHADGRRYAVTYDNWLNRYSPLGFALGALEIPPITPSPGGGTTPGLLDFTNLADSGLLVALGMS